MKENWLLYMSTKFQVNILVNSRVLMFRMSKMALLTLLLGIYVFFFLSFVQIGLFKSVLGRFCVFDDKLAYELASHHKHEF